MSEKFSHDRLLTAASQTHLLPGGLCLMAFAYSLAPSHHFFGACSIVAVLALFLLTCVLLGRTITHLLPVEIKGMTEFPVLFLMGYYCFCTIMLLLAFTSPFSITVNFTAVMVLAVCSQLAVGWKQREAAPCGDERSNAIAGAVGIAVGLCAALVWTHPERCIYIIKGDDYIFPQWVDGFVHAGIFTIFSEANGCADLQKPWMTGTGLTFYHFAGYLPCSILVRLTPCMPIEIYSRFYLPSGFLFAALAAYTMARQWWSAPAAAAAACGVMLIPDASWQGLTGNYFYGFHWMLEASPGLGLALGLVALAWAVMISACAGGRRLGVLCGFAAAGLLVLFKAQLFVGTALLFWFFPIFFLQGIQRRVRIAWLAFAVAVILGLIYLMIRLKGPLPVGLSDTGLLALAISIVKLPFGGFFLHLMQSSPVFLFLFSFIYLFLAVLGWWGAIWLLLVVADPESRRPLFKALFPFLVWINFVVCNWFLDSPTTKATPEEFSQRPFVWAYVVIVAAVSASLYSLFINSPVITRGQKNFTAALICAGCFLFPALLSQRIINPMHWDGVSDVKVDRGFIACAQFLAENSSRDDIVQDMTTDPNFILPPWTGRHDWVSLIYPWNTGANCRTPECVGRIEEVGTWNLMTDPALIRDFAAQRHIRWVVLDPGEGLNWPDSVLDKPAFTYSGYRIIRFY